MTHCGEEKLGAWIDGTLDKSEAAAVAGHLEGCPACRRLASELRLLDDALENLPGAPEREELARNTMAAFRTERRKEGQPGRGGWNRSLRFRLALGAVAAGLLAGVFLGRSASSLMVPGPAEIPRFALNQSSRQGAYGDPYVQLLLMEEDL